MIININLMYVWPFLSETQQLDSNMQYLVYENHSKFITASETIKEVRIIHMCPFLLSISLSDCPSIHSYIRLVHPFL